MNLSENPIRLPESSSDGKARNIALNSISVQIPPTSVVGYYSAGQVLIVGPEDDVTDIAQRLNELSMKCHTLVTAKSQIESEQPKPIRIDFESKSYELTGYFGAFQAVSTADQRRLDLGLYAGLESGKFDLVVEFSNQPTIRAEVPPPGYYWIDLNCDSSIRIEEVVQEIPGMVGSFEKPKYFNYDPDICAHGNSGITACTRCIDACPTDAIFSVGDKIEVETHLCQGGGSCSTACPTGAITYAYPGADSLEEIVQQLLSNYRQAGGTHPSIIFFDRENGRSLLEQGIDSMHENRLPVEVEEVGSVGLDVCLSALVYGASSIKIMLTSETPNSVRRELEEQIQVLHALISGLGHSDGVVELLNYPLSIDQINSDAAVMLDTVPASFTPSGIKRTDIRSALEHLHDHAENPPDQVALPAHAPFGEIFVDTVSCTLCMGCVSVCPAAALEAGGDTPKLSFIEHNCVQCGLCETACPENSISRNPRYLFAPEERMRSRTLNEDTPFHCRMCGKPFASSAMLNKMREKLKGHWMFEKNSEAMQRLEMCEDCRVKDMFAAEGGFPRDKL